MRPQRLLRHALILLFTLASGAGCEELESTFGPAEEEEEDLNAGGGPPAVYQGVYQAEVRYLLGHVGGWRTSRNAQTDPGIPPNVSIGAACIRDAYVSAAVQYAWAAESYYRLRNANATSMAENVSTNLRNANQLCSNAPSGGLNNCRTLTVWGCPPPR